MTEEWSKRKKKRDDQNLADIELQIAQLMDDKGLGFLTEETKMNLATLENHKNKMLLKKEQQWRLKSRATWLQAGDGRGKRLKSTGYYGKIGRNLKWFKKDKSPGPDGWPVEFYFASLELLGGDLLVVIEESRTSGYIHPHINFTYLALIPNTDSPSSFNDFRPISLCNYLYKIISKIISNRIKPILSNHISEEKFSFLHHRHIQDAIGTAQEALHSIKLRNLKGLTLKIDLAKALDKVNWLYINMIITHLGFPPAHIS
eukprot:PITA_09383